MNTHEFTREDLKALLAPLPKGHPLKTSAGAHLQIVIEALYIMACIFPGGIDRVEEIWAPVLEKKMGADEAAFVFRLLQRIEDKLGFGAFVKEIRREESSHLYNTEQGQWGEA